MVISYAHRLRLRRRLREITKPSGNNTLRGFGDHHRIGWVLSYQGKIPWR